MPYRPDIDGLRAIAITAVVAFHAFPALAPGGFVGVDIFFVLSGYLITTSIQEDRRRGRFGVGGFYARRIRRLFPALIVVLACVCAFGWLVLLPDEFSRLGHHVSGGAAFVANVMLWNESGYFDASSDVKPLLHLWSLAIEEQFYIVWPAVLWVTGRRPGYVLIVTVIAAAASFIAGVRALGSDPTAAFYLPHLRAWELLVGGALAALLQFVRASESPVTPGEATGSATSVRSDLRAGVLSGLGIAAIAYGLVSIDKSTPLPGLAHLTPILGAAAIIAAGPLAWPNRRLLSRQPLVWLGLVSYPLYLWHWPLLAFSRILEVRVPGVWLRLVVVAFALLLAWLTARLVEYPRWFGGRTGLTAAALLAAMAGVGGLGYVLHARAGLPARAGIQSFVATEKSFELTRDLGQSPHAQIMLIGDSHAAHLARGFSREFGTGAADYAASGCIPLYGVDRYDSRFAPGACLTAMTTALTLFERNDRMRVVVLSSMGQLYLSGETFKGTDPARVNGLRVTLSTKPEWTDRWAVYREGLIDTLTRLTARHKRIVFAFDVPELGFDPRECVDSRPLRLSPRRSVCGVARKEYEARVSRFKRFVLDILKDFPDVVVFDPAEALCDSEWCWAMKGGVSYYSDPDHLSSAGSEFIAGRMAPLIRGLLEQEHSHTTAAGQ